MYWEIASFLGSGLISGAGNKRALKSEAKANATSATRSFRASEETATAGTKEELRVRQRGQETLASIESMFAEAGLGPEDVAADVLLAAQREIELDALLIRESTEYARRDLVDQGNEYANASQDAQAASRKAFFGLF